MSHQKNIVVVGFLQSFNNVTHMRGNQRRLSLVPSKKKEREENQSLIGQTDSQVNTS